MLAVLKLPYVMVELLSVVLPVTDNVFAIVAEPLTIRSSKPMVSNVIFPETVKFPDIKASPPTVTFDVTFKVEMLDEIKILLA